MNLEQRVAELERRATRYRNALLLMVVGVCAVAVVGATNRGCRLLNIEQVAGQTSGEEYL